MRHLSTQYFNGNQLKEVAAPTAGTDAANKAYVDQAVANAGGGGGSFSVSDDNAGNITLSFSAAVMTMTDDNQGGVALIFS